MPAASVLANPLWKFHEEEVHAWSDPAWSAPTRVAALKHTHITEMQMADSLSESSLRVCATAYTYARRA